MLKNDERVTNVIMTLHGDCHNPMTIKTLRNHCDVVIKVISLDKVILTKNHPKGRIEHMDYDICLENAHVVGLKVPNKTAAKDTTTTMAVPAVDDNASVPTSSFNLALTDKEKDDRSKVEMPYWKKNEAQFHYVPDENDDWDDEDPDDDLDI